MTLHIAGFGRAHYAMRPKDWYLSLWRYGVAAKGEPSTVMQTRWFDTEKELCAAIDALPILESAQ
jgi:hypothetical protein